MRNYYLAIKIIPQKSPEGKDIQGIEFTEEGMLEEFELFAGAVYLKSTSILPLRTFKSGLLVELFNRDEYPNKWKISIPNSDINLYIINTSGDGWEKGTDFKEVLEKLKERINCGGE